MAYKYEPRKVVRKREITVLRAEGAQAFRDGKSVDCNPHRFMDGVRWYEGWLEAQRAAQA